MTAADLTYLGLFFAALLGAPPLLGRWLAAVLQGRPPAWLRWLAPVERAVYHLGGVTPDNEMSWRAYAAALVGFNLLGGAIVLLLQLAQARLPFNPQGFDAVPLGVAVNTAVSFLTNTNWQAYSGEASLSYLTQMAGLGVQNFLSAATGLAVLAAVARGFSRTSAAGLGNFWADLVRTTLYVLLPLSFALAVVLVSQGVVQSFAPYATATTLAGAEQVIPLGPAASQVAIKQLGTNGGGFFGLNSAHPFENPTPLSNFLQTLAILLLPAACVSAYGRLTGARRHARAVFVVMLAFFLLALGLSLWSESAAPGSAALALEGKEVRFGLTPSLLWANATTVASNGSVNAMHSSLSPLAGGIALCNMLLGEIIFGGIGSGLYGMVAVIVLAVFLAGLMVGRTPEYLGKKIDAFEVRMAALAVLLPCAGVLLGCAASFATEAGRAAVGNAGSYALDDKERAVADWAFAHRRSAGRFTDTLPASAGFYLPLVREDKSVGVLGVTVPPGSRLTLAQRDLLEAFARQLALSVERDHLREAGAREKLLAESEKLHRVLLDSVSHELRTPLAVITGSLENLADAPAGLRAELVEEARAAARRLNRLVGNLLDQTRLESGALRPRLDWCDGHDLINAAVDGIRPELDHHPLEIAVPADLPPVRADFALTEQALANLLLNAARHTPPGTPVLLTAGLDRDARRAFFTVADRGPGFPPAMRERLFRKFERGDAAKAGGLGLGLSLVQGFAAAQGGEVVVGENPGGGAVFTLYLPQPPPQSPPPE